MIKLLNKGQSKESYFTFIIKEELYAAPVKNIDCLLEIPANLPAKTNVPFIVGHTTLSNKEIPVIDLAQLLGLGHTKISKKSTLIVLRIKHSNVYLRVGIITDSTYEYKEVETKEVAIKHADESSRKSKFIKGIIVENNLQIKIIDFLNITREIKRCL